MRLKGGLGNQLFQYAVAYSLAKRLRQTVQFNFALSRRMTRQKLDLAELNIEHHNFVESVDLPWQVNLLKNAYINKAIRMLNCSKIPAGDYLYWIETRDEFQKAFFDIEADNLYVDGYFSSAVYFQEYRKELLSQFTPAYQPEKQYLDMLEKIQTSNAVAVHIRRGDFMTSTSDFHYNLPISYYTDAFEFISCRVSRPIFFWFSNDIDWVIQTFGMKENYVFPQLKTTHAGIDDMMLMKNCKHIIAANSTFSWWAAWLNENEHAYRIVPDRRFCVDDMNSGFWKKIHLDC